MDRRIRLLYLSFLESFSTILLERGIYFYTEHELGFTPSQNLSLAFAYGVTYVLGAFVSHDAARRYGERRLLKVALLALLACHLAVTVNQHAGLLGTLFIVTGFFHGLKWPVIGSYIAAGQTPRAMLGAIGRFNVAWSIAVPLAVASVGPMLESPWPPVVFAAASALNGAALWLMWPLPPRPQHLTYDHPERPDDTTLQRYTSLLTSSRWLLLGAYSLLFILAPLLPGLLKALRLEPTPATVSASLLDVAKTVMFAMLGFWAGWQGRIWPVWVGMAALAGGFLLTLLGRDLPIVLLGEILFGGAVGLTYFGALYYAVVIRNAAVDAGGKHESLIGIGFALGPLAGWFGHQMAGLAGSLEIGVLLGAGPLFLTCVTGSLLSLPRRVRAARDGG